MLLMSNATGEAAVDEHIRMFPALGDLDREFNWFRPMMVAIAAELMSKVAYGVKVRAGLGAGLSMADMISDTIVILNFRRIGNMHYLAPGAKLNPKANIRRNCRKTFPLPLLPL